MAGEDYVRLDSLRGGGRVARALHLDRLGRAVLMPLEFFDVESGMRSEDTSAERSVSAAAVRGRRRVPRPDSPKRAPLAAAIPRSTKRTAGRTAPADTPAYIRVVGVKIGEDAKDYLRRKLGRKLGKFSRGVERASVRIEDVNGPRGGVDKRCRIKVVLSGLPSVVVEHRHESLQAAMDGALARVERAVRQAAASRRTKARRPRTGRARAPA